MAKERRKRLYLSMKMKVFWLYTRQCPYPIRFFNLLGETVDLTVAFRHVQKKEHTHFYGDHIKTFLHLLQ